MTTRITEIEVSTPDGLKRFSYDSNVDAEVKSCNDDLYIVSNRQNGDILSETFFAPGQWFRCDAIYGEE